DTAATQSGGAGEKTAAAPRIPEVPRTNESAPAQQAGSASPTPGQAGTAQPGSAQQPPAQQPLAGQPAAEPAARETNTAATPEPAPGEQSRPAQQTGPVEVPRVFDEEPRRHDDDLDGPDFLK